MARLQFTVSEEAGATVLRLPPRQLPFVLRRFAGALNILGLLTFAAAMWPLVAGERRFDLAFYLVAGGLGLALAAYGSRLLYGRVSLICSGTTLRVVERLSPVPFALWRRQLEFGELTGLRVEAFIIPLPAPPAAVGASAGASVASEQLHMITATTVERGRRVLLFAYPEALLTDLISELHRRGFLRGTGVTAPGRAGLLNKGTQGR